MRDYAKVAPQFWTGTTGKALKAAGPEAVIVGLYLMTSPHANMIGLYHCPRAYIAYDTGLGMEGATKGLASAIEAEFCTYDEASEYIFVHAFAEYQIGEALDAKDNRVRGVINELAKVPKGLCWQAFRARYAVPFNLPTPSPSEAPPKSLRSQKQKQKQEQKKQPPQPPDDSGGAFDRFWSAWPSSTHKAAKPQCRAKWESKGCDAIAERVMASLEAHKASSQWAKDKGAFIPAPLVWLNQERWEAATEAQQHNDAGKWDDSRSSIERAGEGAGLGRWDQEAFEHGRGETFAAYTARVRRAIEQPEEEPA